MRLRQFEGSHGCPEGPSFVWAAEVEDADQFELALLDGAGNRVGLTDDELVVACRRRVGGKFAGSARFAAVGNEELIGRPTGTDRRRPLRDDRLVFAVCDDGVEDGDPQGRWR